MSTRLVAGATSLLFAASLLITPASAHQRPWHEGGRKHGTGSTVENGTGSAMRRRGVDLPCMQAAVEKRDNAVIAAFDTYTAALKTALQTRRDALKAAWGITDRAARREGLKVAWLAFRDARRSAVQVFKRAKQQAWEQFRMDHKTCKGEGEGKGDEGVGEDAQL